MEKNGIPHRDNDKPAVIAKDCLEWRQDGKLHRSGGQPAVVKRDIVCWYWKGKLQRHGDMPVLLYKTRKVWMKEGKQTRKFAPCSIEDDEFVFMKNDRPHREDGPINELSECYYKGIFIHQQQLPKFYLEKWNQTTSLQCRLNKIFSNK